MSDKPKTNLTEFLIGVPDAIRERGNYGPDLINPQDFEEKIRNIPQASFEPKFVAIKSTLEVETPERGTLYLLFDVPGFIPEEVPDVSSIKKLFLNGEFDYRKGNIYEDNAVSLFSYTFDYNYIKQIPINISWLKQDMVGLIYNPVISKLVNVSNLNGDQLVCRVAIYDRKWYIIDYWRVQFGFIENLDVDDYFDINNEIDFSDISNLLLDDISISAADDNSYRDDIQLTSYFNITYDDNFYERLLIVDEVTDYDVQKPQQNME